MFSARSNHFRTLTTLGSVHVIKVRYGAVAGASVFRILLYDVCVRLWGRDGYDFYDQTYQAHNICTKQKAARSVL